jgi:7-cyano-7-deazaguanine tRNA-ribosyltransferase
MTLKSMKYLPCSCVVCSKTSVKELLELGHDERTKLLSVHNLFVLKEELEACKEATSEGRLWDLVEERSMAHPRLREAFLEMAKYSEDLSTGTPALKERGLFVRSAVDLRRPELLSAENRLSRAVRRNSRNARLTTNDLIRRGSEFGEAEDGDIFVEHPVFGPVPVELEFQYPFSQTEVGAMVPHVTLQESKRRLERLGYRKVLLEADLDQEGKVRSRRTPWGASPSPPSSSARSR